MPDLDTILTDLETDLTAAIEASPLNRQPNFDLIRTLAALKMIDGGGASLEAITAAIAAHNADALAHPALGVGGSTTAVFTSAIAGTALSGQRVVVLNGSNQAIYADSATVGHATRVIGITTGAVSSGGTSTIQTFGPYTENTWTWTPGSPIFVSGNGVLTQTPPSTGFLLVVATAITATRVFINIQTPFLR